MPIYKPSELQNFLQSLGVTPKKVLSQNFLIDGNIVKNIIQAAKASPRDLILEIGPGPGALTEELLLHEIELIAVERDNVLAKALDRLEVPQGSSLRIFCDDIMTFPIEETIKPLLREKKAKVIANLPYHLTGGIIEKLVQMKDCFFSLTLMIQEEVARRFIAKPRTKEYSSFTLFLHFHADVRYDFPVKRGCFYPSPNVDSAVITLTLKESPKTIDEKKFFTLTRTAFEKRRKMLRASLKELYGSNAVSEALCQINCSPEARPEELSLEHFFALFQQLNKCPTPFRQQNT